jgi:hypothetical protein
VAALLFFTHIPDHVQKESPRTVLPTLHKKLDIIGFVIFAPASIMLLLAVQWGGNKYPVSILLYHIRFDTYAYNFGAASGIVQSSLASSLAPERTPWSGSDGTITRKIRQ